MSYLGCIIKISSEKGGETVSVNARRTEIIRILRGIKQTTAACLADTLNVSTRTIQRDILALTVEEGYFIDNIRGNKGGIVLKDFNNPHKHIFSQEQIQVLTELAQSSDTYQAEILFGILRAYA